MLTFAYCFFSTSCWKNTGILWVHPNLVGNMAVFVARFGCPITTPNLLHFGLKFLFWKLSEDARTRCCRRIWTTLHNQKPKYAIEPKKTSVTGKTHNGQKKMSIRFSRYIYIYDKTDKTSKIMSDPPKYHDFHYALWISPLFLRFPISADGRGEFQSARPWPRGARFAALRFPAWRGWSVVVAVAAPGLAEGAHRQVGREVLHAAPQVKSFADWVISMGEN